MEKITNTQTMICDHDFINGSDGYYVCYKCGIVKDSKIFKNEFSRAFTQSEINKRRHHGVVSTMLLPNIAMSTFVDPNDQCGFDLKKALRWDTRYSWKERNYLRSISLLRNIGSNLELPFHVLESAFKMYKKIYERNLVRGRSIESITLACLYYHVKGSEITRTLDEILKFTQLKKRDLLKNYTFLLKTLNLHSVSANPTDFVEIFASQLDLTHSHRVQIHSLLKLYDRAFSKSGKDPKGIVAGAIYAIIKMNCMGITQTDISNVTGMTEITIRTRHKEFQQIISYIKQQKHL